MRLLVDECVQAQVVPALARDGHDVSRSLRAGQPDSPNDPEVLHQAATDKRLLVTTDTGFVKLSERWLAEGRTHSGVLIGRQTTDLRRFLRDLRHTLEALAAEDVSNQVAWVQKAPER